MTPNNHFRCGFFFFIAVATATIDVAGAGAIVVANGVQENAFENFLPNHQIGENSVSSRLNCNGTHRDSTFCEMTLCNGHHSLCIFMYIVHVCEHECVYVVVFFAAFNILLVAFFVFVICISMSNADSISLLFLFSFGVGTMNKTIRLHIFQCYYIFRVLISKSVVVVDLSVLYL